MEGKIWRAGANEATVFETDKDILEIFGHGSELIVMALQALLDPGDEVLASEAQAT